MKQKNGKIELLRFLFSMVILAYHMKMRFWKEGYLFNDSVSFFEAGYIGVEFFFLLSGFLLGMALDRARAAGETGSAGALPLAEETWAFLWRKIRSILPYHLLFLCLTFVTKLWLTPQRLPGEVLNSLLPDLFFLGRSGLTEWTKTNVWYLEALFAAILILYPLSRKFGRNFNLLVAPLLSVALLAHMLQAVGTLEHTADWDGWLNAGNLRAVAEMSLGLVGYEVYKKLSQMEFTAVQRVLLTGAEAGGLSAGAGL